MNIIGRIKIFLNKRRDLHTVSTIIGAILVIGGLASMIHIGSFCFGCDIWYDEVFSISFIERPLGEIVQLTARDVHPPFYYIYAKIVSGIIRFIAPNLSLITAVKLASYIAGLMLIAVVLIVVSKRYGILAGGICVYLTVLMPQIANYYLEMRMYSLAALLITINMLAAMRLLEADSVRGSLLIMGITGILAAYTQYYAAIAIAGIYLAVLIAALIDKKRKIRNGILLLILASVIAFVPWLRVVLQQMRAISGSYWIQPMSLRSIAGCVKFLFMPTTVDGKLNILGAVLLLASVGIIALLGIITGSVIARWRLLLVALSPLALVVVSGFIFSILGTPIFVYRYMIPAAVGLYIVIALLLADIEHSSKWIAVIPLAIMLLIGGLISGRGIEQEENKKLTNVPLMTESILSIPEDAVVITNFDHVTAVMGYYLKGNSVYLYDNECDPLIEVLLPGSGKSIDIEMMKRMADEGHELIFLGSFNSREELVKDFAQAGMNFELESSFLCERYWINKYVMSNS